jgi:hypothetical protein
VTLREILLRYIRDRDVVERLVRLYGPPPQDGTPLVVRDADGKVYTVRHEAVNAMLLNEFLKEHRKVEEQEVTMTQLKRELQVTATRLQSKLKRLLRA